MTLVGGHLVVPTYLIADPVELGAKNDLIGATEPMSIEAVWSTS